MATTTIELNGIITWAKLFEGNRDMGDYDKETNGACSVDLIMDEDNFKIIEKFTQNCQLEGEKITMDGLRINFKNGWGLLRASNTTPKLVLRFEGDSNDSLISIKESFLNELSRICPEIDINLT